jgi:hypothetical protein
LVEDGVLAVKEGEGTGGEVGKGRIIQTNDKRISFAIDEHAPSITLL